MQRAVPRVDFELAGSAVGAIVVDHECPYKVDDWGLQVE